MSGRLLHWSESIENVLLFAISSTLKYAIWERGTSLDVLPNFPQIGLIHHRDVGKQWAAININRIFTCRRD